MILNLSITIDDNTSRDEAFGLLIEAARIAGLACLAEGVPQVDQQIERMTFVGTAAAEVVLFRSE